MFVTEILPEVMTMPSRIELLDDFAIAFAAMPVRDVLGWTEQLATAW